MDLSGHVIPDEIIGMEHEIVGSDIPQTIPEYLTRP